MLTPCSRRFEHYQPSAKLRLRISSTSSVPACGSARLLRRQPLPAPPHSQRSGIIRQTTFTMPFDFGDILLVPFPFTNATASKKRPAVVVSNRNYNSSKPDIVVMAITASSSPPVDWVKFGSLNGKPQVCLGLQQLSLSSRH